MTESHTALKIKTYLPTAGVTFTFIVMVLMPLCAASSQDIRDEQRRQVFNINQGWSYLEDNLPRVEDLSRATQQWQQTD